MSAMDRQELQRIFHEYEEKQGRAATTREVTAWALANGIIPMPQLDPVQHLAQAMSRALRDEYRTDRLGRRYRVSHAVTEDDDLEGPQTRWRSMMAAPRDYMEKAFAQRRKGIAADCYQLQVDIDVYNDANKRAEPIQTFWDFTDDIAERKLAEGRDEAA